MRTFSVREFGEFIPTDLEAASPEGAAAAYCELAFDDDPEWPGQSGASLTVDGEHEFEVSMKTPPKRPTWAIQRTHS